MNQAVGSTMVAMSGGVDSSVSALILKREERDIAGMFMKNWEEDERRSDCPALVDALDASEVADCLGIELHVRNFSAEYWDRVFEEFLDEYRAGRTPNPDILCNREIKFRTFLDHARELGAEFIATGHYVRTEARDGRHRLLRGRDANKDQSYFLYAVGHEQLARTLFPVGDLDKSEVRSLAEDSGLPVHDKKDSTGICFIGERNFREFLGEYLDGRPGLMKTPEGEVLGEHDGLMFHTLGQRQGLGIGGRRDRPDAPWYVLHKDIGNNVLYVDQGHDHPWLFADHLVADTLSWVTGEAPEAGARLTARVRYRQTDQPCTVTHISDSRIEVQFAEPQRAITPGQSVVLYDGEECLGGGIILGMNAPPFDLGALT